MKKILLFAVCVFALAYAARTQDAPGNAVYTVDALNAKILTEGDRADVLQLTKADGITYARNIAQNVVIKQIEGGSARVAFDEKSAYSPEPAKGEIIKYKIILRNPSDGQTKTPEDVNIAGLFR